MIVNVSLVIRKLIKKKKEKETVYDFTLLKIYIQNIT